MAVHPQDTASNPQQAAVKTVPVLSGAPQVGPDGTITFSMKELKEQIKKIADSFKPDISADLKQSLGVSDGPGSNLKFGNFGLAQFRSADDRSRFVSYIGLGQKEFNARGPLNGKVSVEFWAGMGNSNPENALLPGFKMLGATPDLGLTFRDSQGKISYLVSPTTGLAAIAPLGAVNGTVNVTPQGSVGIKITGSF